MPVDGAVVIETEIDDGKLVKGLKGIQKEMQNTEKEAEGFKSSMEGVSSTTSETGKGMSDLANPLGDLVKGFDAAEFSSSLLSVSLTGLAVGAVGAVVGGFVDMAAEMAATYNEMDRLIQITGFSADGFQEWDAILKQTGYSMDQAQGDISALAEKAMDAANGTGEASEIFEKLGVVVTDNTGRLKSQEDLWNETIFALQDVTNETERAGLATALLSTTGEELASVLNLTNEQLKEMKDGVDIVKPETIESFNKLSDAWTRFTGNAKSRMADFLAPAAEGLANLLTLNEDLTTDMRKSWDGVEETAEDTNAKVQDNQKSHYDKMITLGEEYNKKVEELTTIEEQTKERSMAKEEARLEELYDRTDINDEKRYQRALEKYEKKLDRQLGLDEEYIKEREAMYQRMLESGQITQGQYNAQVTQLGGSSYNSSRSTSNTTNYINYSFSGDDAYNYARQQIDFNQRR